MTSASRARAEIVATARALVARGLTHGKSGNVSVRGGRGMWITPSGLAYESMRAADVVDTTLDGRSTGPLAPSSEWRFHAAIYAARPEVGAVVHAHSRAATALACHRRGIPAFHYMVAVAGGTDVRCAPYSTFGTDALAASAVAALHGRRACLLANHGQIAVGADLASALALAGEVENLADQYLAALTMGEPVLLSASEMSEVLEKFRTYGVPRASKARPARRRRVRG